MKRELNFITSSSIAFFLTVSSPSSRFITGMRRRKSTIATGALLNTEEFRADFERYAQLCFSRFGDRVKEVDCTFNEPYVISIFGHHSGVLAPGRSSTTGSDSKTEPWRVEHTIILSTAL